jgi:putative CocE/NonD family hydrolase
MLARLTRILLVLIALPLFAQDQTDEKLARFILGNYTKFERRIPMRDGTKLFTSIYVPKDATASHTYPILLQRTPYSVAPYGDEFRKTLGPSKLFARGKYIFAYQDVRGKFMSEGEFVDMRPHGGTLSEATDTWDTIEWLVKNVGGNNGRVGMWGISYPGFYASAGMIDAHPALKAVSPQAPIANWWIGDDFHHHGTFFLPHFFNFFYSFGQARPEPTTKSAERIDHGTPDGYEWFLQTIPLSNVDEKFYKGRVAFWKEVVEHPNYDDYWKARNLAQHLRNVKPAVMVVGGWFDAENLYGALETYRSNERQSPGAANMLVMGPWFHGGWARSDGDHLGDVSFHQKTSFFYREHIELPFFDQHLKGTANAFLPEAYVFETGTNEWEKYDAWPPRNAQKRTLYLHPGGRLSFSAPASGEFDEYVSDPAKPVPFQDAPANRMTREYMTADQRLQGRRTDVLTYVSEVLEADLTFAGPLHPSLLVSSTGTDADFVVKLIDVYPGSTPNPDPNPTNVQLGGYQQLVRGEPFRARWRNSFEKPEPLTPNEIAKIEYAMPDVNHTFRAGHRIMIQIQSTWFPLMDINPQTFVPNIYKAKAEDFKKATHRVHRGSAMGVLVVE